MIIWIDIHEYQKYTNRYIFYFEKSYIIFWKEIFCYEIDSVENKVINSSDSQYDFKKILSIPLILNQILQFLGIDDIKSINLCFKMINQLYYELATKLKLEVNIDASTISYFKMEKYKNIRKFDLENCYKIEDFTIILKFKQLEDLNLSNKNISDISF